MSNQNVGLKWHLPRKNILSHFVKCMMLKNPCVSLSHPTISKLKKIAIKEPRVKELRKKKNFESFVATLVRRILLSLHDLSKHCHLNPAP